MQSTADKIYQLYKKHPRITVDSRNVEAGCIFFALKGENFNGNHFATEALKKGAAYCVIDESPLNGDPRFLQVDDTLQTLQQLAMIHRSYLKIPVIGITGSNGKTTTKELTGAVLSQKFQTFVTQGNYNNHIGVPLSILAVDEKTEMAVIEMGANHQGEIAALSQIARPDYGIITNIGKAHLEGFGGYQGVIKAKTELYEFIRNNGGKLFVNWDDDLLMEKSSGIEKITYGKDKNANISGEVSGKYPLLDVIIYNQGAELKVDSNLAGSYNFQNIMVAAAVGNYFGVDNEKIVAGLRNYIPKNNRSQWMDTGKNKIIMDAYNANPTSMMAAINDFGGSPYPQKVVVLGDMLELGDEAETEHRKVLEVILQKDFSHVFLVGENFRSVAESTGFKVFDNAVEARNHIGSTGLFHCTILLKGSRGIALEKVLEVL
jgi:UDP-N-acetylmuramoyl-tripeptide--D-alanyl-D-alanine ligase